MKNTPVSILILLSCVVPAFWGGRCAAEEDPLQFVRALRRIGYSDTAVEYLETLDRRPDLPPEVREVWDLEMAQSQMAAAAEGAFDQKESERLIEESQKHLAKFFKEKPDHPSAANAWAAWGDFLMKQAGDLLQAARLSDAKDKEKREKLSVEARTGLTAAHEKYVQALAKFQKRLADLPQPPKLTTKRPPRNQMKLLAARAEAVADLQDVEFKLAMIDYHLGQTYSDPKNPERIAALQKAGKAFDDIFQKNRFALTRIAREAHAWHGKCAEELGDLQLATDIYDEVLGGVGEGAEKDPALVPLFTQVEYFRLLILAKQSPKDFLPEARNCLQQYRTMRQTDGYQGIAFETAKALRAQAEKATGSERSKTLAEVTKILAEMARTRSSYQQQAILLRRDIFKSAGKSDLDVNTFEEAVAIADAAMTASQWEQARDAYDKALELAAKQNRKNVAEVEAVREARGRALFAIARGLFDKGKLTECIEQVSGIVFEDAETKTVRKSSPIAAQASALAGIAALNLYVDAPEDKKPAALERLIKTTEFTEKNWPDRPEADDARMNRAQAKLVAREIREAIAIFDRVNPKSERYPLAMYRAAQNYAALYSLEKRKPENARDAKQMADDRAKAVERLESGLAAIKKQTEPDKAAPKTTADTQLLLAELRLEGGEAKEAAALYQPLVDAIKAAKPQSFDETTGRVFLGAVKAYSALGDFDRAGAVGDVLIDLGPDTLPVNYGLTEFARLLDFERKKAQALVTELETTTKDAECAAAKKRLDSIVDLLGKVLVKLAKRKEVSPAGMVFIGDALGSVGRMAEASEEYQKIIKRTETDPEFAKTAQKAMTRVRSQLVGILRKQGQFEEALKQVEQLIKDNPRAVEPLMEKGRILKSWADKDPSKFKAAVDHWVSLRLRLQSMRKKPPEYYEVMYNVAACLMREAETSKDKAVVMDRALKAEKALNAALIFSPKLNGPDTVARYKVLLNKAIILQGRKPKQGEK